MVQTLERIQILDRLKSCGLNNRLVQKYSIDELSSACDRVDRYGLSSNLAHGRIDDRIQRELVQNPAFAQVCRKLIDNNMFDEERVASWLVEADLIGDVLTDTFTPDQLVSLAGCGLKYKDREYGCMKFFQEALQDEGKYTAVVDNLNSFCRYSAEHVSTLTDTQRCILSLPYFNQFSKERLEEILGTEVGYLNALYAGNLKIPFDNVPLAQRKLLVFAIAHKKKRFLELVNQNFELFLSVGSSSMIVERGFFHRCNLNSLTLKNIKESRVKYGEPIQFHLLDDREYTFEELQLLCSADAVYIKLYNKMSGIGVDKRIIVMRELLKRRLLTEDMSEEQLEQLARVLSQKPLGIWMQKELSHIKGLSRWNAVRILRSYDKIAHLLPEIETWEEAVFAARNADLVQKHKTWAQAQNNIIQEDKDWNCLVDELGISSEFIKKNQKHIMRFLMNEGAEMTRIYCQGTSKLEAFHRIIRAELMGKFSLLKYHKDDLNKEISYPISTVQQKNWQQNTSISDSGIYVEEADDFYTTLRLGELPHRTCLSYIDGPQRECLLSGYDSNKKILLAKQGEKVVGRAIIRLTKGSFSSPMAESDDHSLEFVDLLDKGTPKQNAKDVRLTLFLERPYFAHVNDHGTEQIKKVFVELVKQKANQLGAILVLANDYGRSFSEDQFIRANYYLYISKSKGGAQYLDSLSGSAYASEAGRFESRPFWIARDADNSDSQCR